MKLLAIQVTITKNLSEQPWPKSFAGVDWHYRRTTIGVMNKMVTPLDAEYFKTSLLQGRQQFLAGQTGDSRHAAIEMR